jgi:hypothetical protein
MSENNLEYEFEEYGDGFKVYLGGHYIADSLTADPEDVDEFIKKNGYNSRKELHKAVRDHVIQKFVDWEEQNT